ncbi:MAG TPA: hypothetical protein VJM82_00755 [Nitrospiraceae bacterium]|nr:hypothetical protein [Nitrospiraceae bacterium]
MRKRHHLGWVALGLGTLLTVLSCASTEDRRGQELADGFNKWLGQFKENRIVQVGPPKQCTAVQNGGGEICEWRTNGGQLLYSYDVSGIARSWSYTDSQFGRMESTQYPAQSQQSQGSFWQTIKETFRGMKFGYGVAGR